ncbi:MAG: hypothetical protein CME68_04420 [Halobacteriovoraceae bacterium]|nr:hypothetical protein [Halobacteriovoraceae bacterium]
MFAQWSSTISTTKTLTADEIIKKLNLSPHPEGGWYKRTYQSEEEIGTPYIDRGQNQKRFLKTGIYYLLSGNQKSLLHRIKSDEMWHFYLGDPLTLIEITPLDDSKLDKDHKLSKTVLGPNLLNNEVPQYTVKKGSWFGGYLERNSGFCLVGCTVSPGFDFKDFEMASPSKHLSDLKDHPIVQNLLPS